MEEERKEFHLVWGHLFNISNECNNSYEVLFKDIVRKVGRICCAVIKQDGRKYTRSDMESTRYLASQNRFAIYDIKGKGRGLTATNTLEEGTLLITESLIACSWHDSSLSTFPESTRLAIHWYLRESSHKVTIEQKITSSTSFANDTELAHSLEAHIHHQRHKWEDFLFYSILSYEYLYPEETMDDRALDCIWNLFVKHCQIPCNTFAVKTLLSQSSVQSGDVVSLVQKKKGIAIYPLASLLNHSCSPNAHISFDDLHQITLRTSRKIQAGEEICISYGCLSSNVCKEERQRLLLQNYFFLCECESCSTQNTEKSGYLCHCGGELITQQHSMLQCNKCNQQIEQSIMEKKIGQYEAMIHLGDGLVNQQRIPQAIKAFEKGLEIIVSVVDKMDYRVGRACDRLAECYALQNNFTESVKYCQKSVDIISALYGDTAVETANELLKLVDLYFSARDIDGTLLAIKRASRALRVCYGNDNENVKRMCDMKKFLQQKKGQK